jgi:hypothetical protein
MMSGAMGSTEGPTATHRSQYSIVEAELKKSDKAIKLMVAKIAAKRKAIDQ